MAEEKQHTKKEELDRFWDVEDLIPRRRTVPAYPSDTDTTEVVLEPVKVQEPPVEERIPPRGAEEPPRRHFIPPHTAQEAAQKPKPELEYVPESSLLHRVCLYRHKSNYDYYEAFVRDVIRLYPIHGEPCQRVPFFSYVPQYSQLNREQLEWYLWWREQVRGGEYPDTDYSYLLLYAYELIHLAGKIDPLGVRDGLCRLWEHYRGTFHQLDSYLPEWICDCSLIHRLPPPTFGGRLLGDAMSHCHLKEFYVSCAGEDGYLRALLVFCSNYDYHKSKFCTKENRELFDRAVLGALQEASKGTASAGKPFSAAGLEDSRMIRDAYTGALCASRIKKRIEVEYCSFSRSHELRFLITDIVKYTENKIRASLGIRSRLTVYALPNHIRELLDAYLQGVLPSRVRTVERDGGEIPAYEKLYDLPRTPLSFHAAEEIERLSWDTTRRLVEAFEEDSPQNSTEDSPQDTPTSLEKRFPVELAVKKDLDCFHGGEQGSVRAFEASAGAFPYRAFLLAVRDGDIPGQKAAARELGKPSEVLADEINALSADRFGDILLEENGTAYEVIEDYESWLEELIHSSSELAK